MKKLLFIARTSDSPYAVEQMLDFTEHTVNGTNDIRVIRVNVPHYSLIYAGLLQIAEKIQSGQILVSNEAREFVQHLIWVLNNKSANAPSEELVSFVARKIDYPWLRSFFCIYVDEE